MKKKLVVYLFAWNEERQRYELTHEKSGALVRYFAPYYNRRAAYRFSAHLCWAFGDTGQPTELRQKNRKGKYGRAATFPPKSDPRKSKG